MKSTPLRLVIAIAILLASCGARESALAPAGPDLTKTRTNGAGENKGPLEIEAQAGIYRLDPYHATLEFRVNHLGLSNYVARFTRFDATLELDPGNVSASSIAVSVDLSSIQTDFSGNFPATHPDSPYKSWEEQLARDPNFFNADQHPEITFRSTVVESVAGCDLSITGELSLLGQTHLITLCAAIVGSLAKHPITEVSAIGFSAEGAFNRSLFGMEHLLEPPLISDQVDVRFDGEFHLPLPEYKRD